MGYTIVEYLDAAEQRTKRAIGTYDCAYDAVDAIRAALQSNDDRVWSWYLVDEVGTVLFGPTDLAAIMAESDEFEAQRRRNVSGARRPPGAPQASGRTSKRTSGVRRRLIAPGAARARHAGGLPSDSDLSWD